MEQPICDSCKKIMTRENAKLHPEWFLCDVCINSIPEYKGMLASPTSKPFAEIFQPMRQPLRMQIIPPMRQPMRMLRLHNRVFNLDNMTTAELFESEKDDAGKVEITFIGGQVTKIRGTVEVAREAYLKVMKLMTTDDRDSDMHFQEADGGK